MRRRRDVRRTTNTPSNTPMTAARIVLSPIDVNEMPSLPPVSDFVASIILSQIMTSNDDSALQTAMELSAQATESPVLVLSRAQARQCIEPRRWSRGYAKDDDPKACPICMDAFKYPKSVARMECGHLFCSSCIRKWVTCYSATCPVCRHCIGGSSSEQGDEEPPSQVASGFSVEV